MQASYPTDTRGYKALNLAIVALSQLYETNEHILSIKEHTPHLVTSKDAVSIVPSGKGYDWTSGKDSVSVSNIGNVSGTITVGDSEIYWGNV